MTNFVICMLPQLILFLIVKGNNIDVYCSIIHNAKPLEKYKSLSLGENG